MFGEFYYNSCLSLLLQLVCSIHTTWCIDLSRSLYFYILRDTWSCADGGNLAKLTNQLVMAREGNY